MHHLSHVVIAAITCTALSAQEPIKWTFEDPAAGTLPHGWTAAKTGEGPGSKWKIVKDETAPSGSQVIAQVSSEGPNRLFNLCIADETSYRNVDLSVALKAESGKFDQGGGPIWRCRDADNYYVARANPLESNYRVYKVVAGKRTQLGSFDVETAAGKWYTIRILHEGRHIRCYLDGKLCLDVKDDQFADAGKIGLWTKADAVTSFDDLRVKDPAAIAVP
jgi:hypothetical protein